MASSTGGWKSRDELKQQKEIEEARKAGTIAPATDEYGRDISPHIPQYIAQAPWYLKKDGPTLSHQRLTQSEENAKTQEWYLRGAKKAFKAKVFRKGACENCGAMGHNAKLCLERPRKKTAKQANKAFAADDVDVPDLNLTYDGARDRWNGYDPNEYKKVMERYQKVEVERRKIIEEEAKKEAILAKAEKQAKKENAEAEANNNNNNESEDKPKFEVPDAPAAIQRLLAEDEDDKEEEDDFDVLQKGDEDQVGTKVDSKTRTTIRNLRIREDTAKYLINLDANSAFYDPKTRSMRGNPLPDKDESQLEFAGENVIRSTGSAKEFDKMTMYTIEANEKGQFVHMQAAPSQSELLHREYEKKKEALLKQQNEKILAKYGGQEHLKEPSKALLFGQTEAYIEYTQDGKPLSGLDVIARSKWPEDQLTNNHTQIWGSYWSDGRWGFGCCYQTERNSFCTGEAGKRAILNAKNRAVTQSVTSAPVERDEPAEKPKSDTDSVLTGQKRKYNSFVDTEVTEEDMDEYKRKRIRSEDPLANYVSDL